jgi:dipeptidyl aminopeptidase/acylaminoacyl peptidase
MKRKSLVIISLTVALSAVFLFYLLSKSGYKKISIIQSENELQKQDEKTETENFTVEKTFDLISIPVFSQKEFFGSDFKVGQILEQNGSYTRYYITYESGGLTISGIMNVPRGKSPFPVLFLNHGYIDPEIYTNGRGLKREQDYLSRNGYIVVHSDYRNHAGSDKEEDPERPDLRFGYAEDVINGVEALKKAKLPYADTEKIGMLGHSMGGGVAEIIAVAKPELVRAIVLFAPVSADQKDNFDKWTKNDPEREAITVSKFGTPENNPEFWKNASPINFFDKVQVPIIIHHGTSDDSCALEWSERAVDALKAAGKDATLYTYSGEPHEFIDAWPAVMKRSLDFFDKYVKNKIN